MGDFRKRPTTITSMVRKTNAKNRLICMKFLGHLNFLKYKEKCTFQTIKKKIPSQI